MDEKFENGENVMVENIASKSNERKEKKGIIVGIVLAIVVIVVGCFLYVKMTYTASSFLNQSSKKINAFVNEAFEGITFNKDYLENIDEYDISSDAKLKITTDATDLKNFNNLEIGLKTESSLKNNYVSLDVNLKQDKASLRGTITVDNNKIYLDSKDLLDKTLTTTSEENLFGSVEDLENTLKSFSSISDLEDALNNLVKYLFEALKEADVKIVNVDTQVKEMDYVDAYIGSDNYNAGVLCGEDLIKRCPDGGKVAILECPTQNSVNERITGFEETLAKAENGFEIVAREDTSGEFQKSLEAAQKILSENSDIVAIMCGNDQMAVGAKTAMNVAEQGQILIYGVDGSPDIKKELVKKDSVVAGTVAQSPISMGKDAANTVLNILNGKDYEKEIKENVFMINQENVDMYGVDGWQ